MNDLVSRKEILLSLPLFEKDQNGYPLNGGISYSRAMIEAAPGMDAVFVETIEAWLYQIAMNNTDNYLCSACEEIISRLDGLRTFAKEKEA